MEESEEYEVKFRHHFHITVLLQRVSIAERCIAANTRND